MALRLGPRRAFVVSHPELIRQVAVVERHSLRRGYSAALLRTVLGDGLLVSEGDHWERQRRIVQPAMRDHSRAAREAVADAVERMLRSWTPGEVRDVHEEMRRLTLDVAARVILGVEPRGASGPLDAGLEVMVAGEAFSALDLVPGLRLLPTPTQRRARAGQAAIDALVMGAVARGDGAATVLGRLDGRMDVASLRDELVTLLFTAFDTTAAALCWTLYLLATHPMAADLADGDPSALERVLLESLRLYPPVPIQARDVVRPTSLDGIDVPAGSTILWSQWVVHRDARWFERPTAFDPDRWTGGLAERLHPFAYFPFGGGRRNCVGEELGMTMLRAILASLVEQVRLEPVAGYRARPYALVTLRPRGGMPMRLAPTIAAHA